MSDKDRIIYWVIGAVVVVLAVVGLFTYSGEKQSAEAEQKAQQLTASMQQAGLAVPNQNVLVRTLGTDGGNICDNPADALGTAHLLDQLVNGGSHVGRRPVIVDRSVLAAEALILQTYCPEKLQDFRSLTNDLKTDDTIKD